MTIETKVFLLSKRDNPKEFFLELHRIRLEERGQNEKQLTELIVDLNKENGIDFCQVALDAITDGINCFDVIHVLEDALPNLNLNISTILQFTEKLFELMQRDIMADAQFRPFQGLVVKQPDFSRSLLSEFLKQDKPYVVGYVANFYQELSKKNIHEIHEELCSLKTHNSQYVLMAAAGSLGELNYKLTENCSLVNKTIKVLEELEAKNSDEINRLAIFAYRNLLSFTKEAEKKLIQFSKTNSLLIQGALSQVLFSVVKEYGNKKWFSEVLLNLSTVSGNNSGIIENIDFVLAELLEVKGNWELAEEFFRSWLVNSDYQTKNNKLSKLYDSTFASFVKNRESLEKLVTDFFNDEDWRMHKAASEIINYLELHEIVPLQLNKETLETLSYEDCLYICRKILGYVIFSEHLCSLCFSFLCKFPQNQEIQNLVYRVFKNHIGENYPDRTIEFLKKISETSTSDIEKNIALQVIREIESYHSQKNALPHLKELIAQKQKSQKVLLERKKKLNTAFEKAQKNSIVSMLSTKINLKNGTGSFHFMNDQYSEISKLSSYSTEIEMPYSEISHPVTAAIERTNFRLAKKGAR